jgi:hypothetical protein
MILGSVRVSRRRKEAREAGPALHRQGARPHRLDHVLHRVQQRSHLISLRALTLKSRTFCVALSAGLAEAGLLRP